MSERYQLGDEVGSGATSQVFVAQDTKLRRAVAYKRLLDEVASDPTVRKCFHREAQALARVRHKNVVAVHDYSGKESAELFLVMELVKGKDLARWTRERGRLEESMLWAVLCELGGALEACHALSVVHRDLKPENLILTPQGRLVLVDFGIARSYDTSDTLGSSAGTQVMGTPDFMSPEQAGSSNELTGASDVFSLGAVVYTLASGKKPFEGDTVLATLKKIVTCSFTPLKQLRPELSNELIALCERCLQLDIEARPKAGEIGAQAKRQLAKLGLKPEALLADFVAEGKLGTSKLAKQKEIVELFDQLARSMRAKDKLETRRVRRRILELDPDNESVFELRVDEPPPARSVPETVKMDQSFSELLAQGHAPRRTPWLLVAAVGGVSFAAGAALVFSLVRTGLLR